MVPLVARSSSPPPQTSSTTPTTIATSTMMADNAPHRFIEQKDLFFASTSTENVTKSGVDVSAVSFPLTDNPQPSFFICGRNSGVLSLYRISDEQDEEMKRNQQDVSFALAQQLRFPSAINDVNFSGDGLRIVASLEDGTVRFIDTYTLREIDSVRSSGEGSMTCACYAPQSNIVVAGTYGGAILSYDARAPRQLIRRLSPAHGCPVSAVSFHPDGSVFLSTGVDSLARVWDATGPCLATLIGSSDRGLSSGVFSPNGRYALLGAMDNGALGLWDLAECGKLKMVRRYPRVNSRFWMRAAFTEDGDIVAGSEDGKLLAWNSSTARLLAEYDCTKRSILTPLACATSKSHVVFGGIGSPDPCLLKLTSTSSME